MRYFAGTCLLYSLRKQATAAVVQLVSSAVIKQVPSAATLDFACRRRKRRPRTISLADLVALPRPFDTFVNATPGPYVPGGRVEALAFTLSVIVTPLVSVAPDVELAVSQDGALIE